MDLCLLPSLIGAVAIAMGLKLGLRNLELDESEVPTRGPGSLVSERGGGAETSNHQTDEGT